ncbi:MAG TPA: nitroreductase [bacterium]|nr:nitroreductase [bacterium]
MDVKEAIEKRRAYRSLEPVEITGEIVMELVEAARLAPSCFNNQPWKFVFVRSKEALEKMKEALNKGNEWARAASCIIAVFAKKEYDCVIKEREYYLLGTGLGLGQMLLRATELGLVAHPIAGYSPEKTAEILGIPEGFNIITLVIVGKKSPKDNNGLLNEKQEEGEKQRPERMARENIYSVDRYDDRLDTKAEH